MSCSGPCKQGRLACPTPEACRAEQDNDMNVFGVISIYTMGVVVGVLAAWFFIRVL
jgi:hypothetical protein